MPGYHKTMNLLSLSVCAAACLSLSACSAPQVVRPGDKAQISFDCRLPAGELAATTFPDASVAQSPKSPLYLPRTGPESVEVTAGAAPPRSPNNDRLSFEEEIMEFLAQRIPGMHEGERARFELEAARYPVSSPTDKLVKIAKVRKRQKEMRISGEEFIARTGKSPELGAPFVLDRMFPGKVSEVTDKEVLIHFAPVAGESLTTPFGAAAVREFPDHYELEIKAEKGNLIRTGGMAGRIAAVDGDLITIDYGHPFAGERLACEVKVVRVEPAPAASAPDPAMARQLVDALRGMSAVSDGVGADAGKAEGEAR